MVRKRREKDISEIPLKKPDRSEPEGKTLLDIAEERREELFRQADAKSAKNARSKNESSTEPELIGPFGEALLYGSTLTMLHFTLDVLVYNQYRQDTDWNTIAWRTLQAFPMLLVLLYVFHVPSVRRLYKLRQTFFTILSTFAGCYLIRSVNKEGYFAVMQRAPSLGTLWIWSVIELSLPLALLNLGLVAGYVQSQGFSIVS